MFRESLEFGPKFPYRRQLAYKITMNSVYGLCGATRGILPCVEIAAAVTSTGRNMIDHSKRMVEDMYQGSEVIYGDSVTGPTPTTVRVAGRVYVEAFERLADRWGGGKWLPCHHGDKESCELPGVDVWTEEGWTPTLRVIRHRLAPEKRILRVLTHTGMVDATDDHSLLDAHGQAVSARNVDVGFELLHAPYPPLGQNVPITPDEARALGTCCPKVVPDAIMNASVEARQAFWDGVYDKDANWRVSENQVSMASYALLASSLGYSLSFDACPDEPDVFRLFLQSGRCNLSAVARVVEVAYDGWVYDMTTKNHHFAAGVGQLVVHNTDSIFVCFQPDMRDVKEAFGLGAEAAALVTKTFKRPIELEFEKVYCPLLLIGKKRCCPQLFHFFSAFLRRGASGALRLGRETGLA
jgi:hypothetical protein